MIKKIVRTEPKNALFLSKKQTIWNFFIIYLSLKTKNKSESLDLIDEQQKDLRSEIKHLKKNFEDL